MNDYIEFLKSKSVVAKTEGFEPSPIAGPLFGFQKRVTEWAIRKGRAAIFADCGMGKTLMQLEWARQVCAHTGGDVIIIAPLAVAQQTVREGLSKLGLPVNYCRDQSGIVSGVNIINYEMLHKFDASKFVGVVLDESSILKSFTGQTKRELVSAFSETRYRLACTATPSPNDYMELGNHSQFLGVMDSTEMLSRFFINDTMSAGSYRVKGHARKVFWQWVASWAMSLSKPSDLGFDDAGFDLPAIDIKTHIVDTTTLPPPPGEMFRNPMLSATNLHSEMRETAPLRADKVASLIAQNPNEAWLIWCNTNYEADALKAVIPSAQEVRGSDSIKVKEDLLNGFVEGRVKILITKPTVAGFGMNFQHCHNMAFMGMGYSFENYYQAIRRCYRFGQKSPVSVHVVMGDSEGGIWSVVKDKEREHETMKKEMSEHISEAHNAGYELQPVIDPVFEEGDDWRLYLGDCVGVCSQMESGSVDFSVFSPPFSNLYIYSDSVADMGNSLNDDEFFKQFKFLAEEMNRITRKGRLAAIHCKDLPLYKNRDGAAGLRDFPGRCIRMFEECGWTFHSRVTIWKDPVIEMQRTKNHGLLYKQLCKDSAASRQGMADYLIVMRKWDGDEAEESPVTRDGGERFFDYVGCSGPAAKDISKARTDEERIRLYSIAVWQRYASPVWFDINQTNVLNKQQARDCADEKHICPLQLDVIERAVELWSNPGDTVFSPFTGIGSEGYVALKMGRKFVGAELKDSYFRIAVKNLKHAASLAHSEMALEFTP